MKNFVVIIPGILGALLSQCSPVASVAGAGSETTNSLVAIARYPSGDPAVHATVRLRPETYLADTTGLAKQFASVKELFTDENGRFEIDSMDTGSYMVEVTDQSAAAALLRVTIAANTGRIDRGIAVLKSFASVLGSTFSSYPNGYALVQGLEHAVRIDAAGLYRFGDLPEGTYSIILISRDTLPAAIDSVPAVSGDTAIAPAPGWRFTKRIVFTTTGAGVTQDVYEFPVLIRLAASTFDFSKAKADGTDIRFINNKGSPLPYEIEQWDAVNKTAAVWVKVDTVRGNDSTIIVMQFGNPAASSQSNGPAVFDTANGFTGVWHLGGPSAANRLDATAHHLDGQTVTYDGDESVQACIGAGDSLDTLNDAIHAGNPPINQFLTMSLWLNPAAYHTWGHLIAKASDSASSPWLAYGIQFDTGATVHLSATVTTDNGDSSLETISPVAPGVWTYVTATYDGAWLRIYFNGQLEAGTPLTGAIITNAREVYFGKLETSPEQRFCGILDEVRISKVARSPAWIKLCYENQKPNSTTLHFSP